MKESQGVQIICFIMKQLLAKNEKGFMQDGHTRDGRRQYWIEIIVEEEDEIDRNQKAKGEAYNVARLNIRSRVKSSRLTSPVSGFNELCILSHCKLPFP